MYAAFIRLVGLIALAWVVAAIATFIQRAPYSCGPYLLSEGCTYALLNNIGDLVTFRWVSEWEGIVGAMIAITAAGIGARYVQQQINESRGQLQLQRLHKAKSLRAFLPLHTMAIDRHLRLLAAQIVRYHDTLAEESFATFENVRVDWLAMPLDTLVHLQGTIEFDENPTISDATTTLIMFVQFMYTGLEDLFVPGHPDDVAHKRAEAQEVLFRLCVAFGHNVILYIHARPDKHFTVEPRKNVWRAVGLLELQGEQFRYVHERIRQKYGERPELMPDE